MTTVYVISDLHLGGSPRLSTLKGGPVGSQINSSYRHLTQFIDLLAETEAIEGGVELVINGDFVDFLLPDEASPSPSPWTCDEDEVIRKLDAIVASSREAGGRGPFDALADFCGKAADGIVSLVLILGNHDIELSLPKVRQHLLRNVLKSDGRGVRFIYDNEAYYRGDLLIEHGNRYDSLNAVDHDCLRRERSALSRGEDLSRIGERFTPPGGSVLVTELFNPLKETYRFLDLLKPEKEAVIPIMLALEPKATGMISAILQYSKVKIRSMRLGGEFVVDRGYISAGGENDNVDLSTFLQDTLGSDAEEFGVRSGGSIGVADAWLTIQELKRRVGEWLLGLDKGLFAGRNRKQLSIAMKKLAKDTSFKIDHEIDPYLSEARRLASSGRFSTIVFGHTHLPKQVDIQRCNFPPARYLNTGTWVDVMLVPAEIMVGGPQVETEINNFLERLATNQLQRVRYLTYARIQLRQEDAVERVQSAEIRSYRCIAEPVGEPLMEACEA